MSKTKETFYGIVCITDNRIEQIGDYSKDLEFMKSKLKELNKSNNDKSKRYAALTVKS